MCFIHHDYLWPNVQNFNLAMIKGKFENVELSVSVKLRFFVWGIREEKPGNFLNFIY